MRERIAWGGRATPREGRRGGAGAGASRLPLPPRPIAHTIKDMTEDVMSRDEIASAIQARRELDDGWSPR